MVLVIAKRSAYFCCATRVRAESPVACAALELAMSECRLANPHGGIDLGDVTPRLLDMRFADDILIFANTKEEVQNLLNSLVRHLATAGLVLNTSKTVALTTESQPLSFIQVGDGDMIKVLGYSKSHKWFGCMLCAFPGLDSDVEYYLQQAATAFQKHRWILLCKDPLSNIDCGISKQLLLQQLASLQSTDHHTENIWWSMMFSFENLFVALWGLHRAQIGQHNGMIFCMNWICGQITGSMPMEFLLGQRNAWLNPGIFRFLHCKFTGRTLGEEDACMATTSNISSAWTPETNLGHEIKNVLQVQGFGQLGDCCEKCGPMGLSLAVFPGFLLYVIIFSTFSERCL